MGQLGRGAQRVGAWSSAQGSHSRACVEWVGGRAWLAGVSERRAGGRSSGTRREGEGREGQLATRPPALWGSTSYQAGSPC